MSSNQTARSHLSNDNLTAILNATLAEYERVTGQCLGQDPLAVQLEACISPDAILSVLQKQVKYFTNSNSRYGGLSAILKSTTMVLHTFSSVLGEGVGLVSHIRRPFRMTILQHLVRRHSHRPM